MGIRNKIKNIFQERKEDINQIKNAEDIFHNIMKNIDKVEQPFENLPIYSCNRILGKELYISFIDNKKMGHGFGTIGIYGKNYRSIVFDLNFSDIQNAFKKSRTLGDLLLNLKSYMIHELIHFNDSFRVTYTPKVSTKDKNYYNTPSEFNAYYLQYSQRIYEKIDNVHLPVEEKLKWFRENFGNTEEEFLKYFFEQLKNDYPDILGKIDKKYKFKWNKRIYQLYSELQEYIKKSAS